MSTPITSAARERIERLSAEGIEKIRLNPENRQAVLTETLGAALQVVLDALEEIEENKGDSRCGSLPC